MAGSNQLPACVGSWTIRTSSRTTGNCVGNRCGKAERGGHSRIKRIRATPARSDGNASRKITARFVAHEHRWALSGRSGEPTAAACRHREIASIFRAEATCGEITMRCDKYDDLLLLAAASNDKLDSRLARHLVHCSTCRTTLRSERELFSRIDIALRAQVNESLPPSFLPQLRLLLS